MSQFLSSVVLANSQESEHWTITQTDFEELSCLLYLSTAKKFSSILKGRKSPKIIKSAIKRIEKQMKHNTNIRFEFDHRLAIMKNYDLRFRACCSVVGCSLHSFLIVITTVVSRRGGGDVEIWRQAKPRAKPKTETNDIRRISVARSTSTNFSLKWWFTYCKISSM